MPRSVSLNRVGRKRNDPLDAHGTVHGRTKRANEDMMAA